MGYNQGGVAKMKSLKGFSIGLFLLWVWTIGTAQQNVSITISLFNPSTPEYQIQVVNNNTSGWAVDQLHVLYSTPNVLQATFVPTGWSALPDVPWDAIPYALRFEANSATDRIPPGGGSKTFRFKMNTKTPVADFYVQFRVTQGTESKEYVKRVKVPQLLNVPSDVSQVQQVGVLTPGSGLEGQLRLRFRALFPIPTLRYSISTFDSVEELRDRVEYPPAPIPPPPHLDHFFLGSEERIIDAEGAPISTYWTICGESAQWNGGTTGIANLSWERDIAQIRRPSACWQFLPSLRTPRGERIVRFRIANCGSVPFSGTLQLYLRGDRLLNCGEELANWPRQFPPDFVSSLTLLPGVSEQFDLQIPANVQPRRIFYGALDMQFENERATTLHFSHQEVEAPLLVGLLENFGAGRPIAVQVENPATGFRRIFPSVANADGVWRILLDTGTGFDFFGDAGFFLPLWQVRVKPRGALSQTFREVLIPGGDTIDPYLRMQVVLGDVNGDDCIDDADLLLVLFSFGSNNPDADLNGDGIVDDADLLIVLFNFGQGC